eukprot:scaffold6568_cov60-Phaeocystis_antarctica.AAC.5
MDYGDEAVEKQLREYAQRGFGGVGRVRTGAEAHTARYPSQHWRWALRRAPASAKAQRPRCR